MLPRMNVIRLAVPALVVALVGTPGCGSSKDDVREGGARAAEHSGEGRGEHNGGGEGGERGEHR